MADYCQDSLDPGNLEKKKNATEQESKKRLKAPAKSDIMGGSPGNDGKCRVSG
jgi:hypothetical protein